MRWSWLTFALLYRCTCPYAACVPCAWHCAGQHQVLPRERGYGAHWLGQVCTRDAVTPQSGIEFTNLLRFPWLLSSPPPPCADSADTRRKASEFNAFSLLRESRTCLWAQGPAAWRAKRGRGGERRKLERAVRVGDKRAVRVGGTCHVRGHRGAGAAVAVAAP